MFPCFCWPNKEQKAKKKRYNEKGRKTKKKKGKKERFLLLLFGQVPSLRQHSTKEGD